MSDRGLWILLKSVLQTQSAHHHHGLGAIDDPEDSENSGKVHLDCNFDEAQTDRNFLV